jgi:hypothetical protein
MKLRPPIDLGRPPVWPERLGWALLALLVAAAAGSGAWLLASGRWPRAPQPVAAPAPRPAPMPDPPYLADARTWLRLAEAPVGDWLAAVESAAVPGVRLLQLDLDAAARTGRAELEAADHAEAVAWIADANQATSSSPWRLLRSERGPAGVRAVVEARW